MAVSSVPACADSVAESGDLAYGYGSTVGQTWMDETDPHLWSGAPPGGGDAR